MYSYNNDIIPFIPNLRKVRDGNPVPMLEDGSLMKKRLSVKFSLSLKNNVHSLGRNRLCYAMYE